MPLQLTQSAIFYGDWAVHLAITGIALSKLFLVLLPTLALAGCAVGHITLPMTLGPGDTSKASCLTYADSRAFADCKSPEVSIPRDTK